MADIWQGFLKIRDLTKDYEPFGKQVYNTHYQRILPIKKESTNNFLTKALIGKILFDKKISFVTEWQMKTENKIIQQPSIINLDNNTNININSKKEYKEFNNLNIHTNNEINELIKKFEEHIKAQL